MEYIKFIIKVISPADGKPLFNDFTREVVTREDIRPASALETMEHVFGSDIVDKYYCTEQGERIEFDSVKVVKTKTPLEIRREALEKKAKDYKIKGWHLMSDEKLEKAIQEAYKKQTA